MGFKALVPDERLVGPEALIDPDLLAGLTVARHRRERPSTRSCRRSRAYTSLRANPLTDARRPSTGSRAGAAMACSLAHRPGWLCTTTARRARDGLVGPASGICLANAGLGSGARARPRASVRRAIHMAAPRLRGRSWSPRHGQPRGWQSVPEGRRGLARYARAGRVLAEPPPTTDDEAARVALLDLLVGVDRPARDAHARARGLTADHFDAVLAGVAQLPVGHPVALGREDSSPSWPACRIRWGP